jgi:polar amino acid transport system substrate-binding protein
MSRLTANTGRLLATLLTAALLQVLVPIDNAAAAPLRQVLTSGKLRVGIVLAAPWAFRAESGVLEGFEIDVATRLAADLDVTPEFVVYDYGELIPAIEAGEIDIVAAGLSITPERALHVNFSRPYATGGIGMATNIETTAAVDRLEALDSPDYRIAVLQGSVAAALLERILPRAAVESFEAADQAAAALLAGRVDAYLDDEPIPTFLALENPRSVDNPITRPLLETRSAFAVAKGDPDFLAYLAAWIEAHEADTFLPSSHQYWFKSLEWRK